MLRDIVSGGADWALWLAAIVAGLAALGKLGHYGFRIVKWGKSLAVKIDRLDELASYELQHNGGGSIKDAASMIPPMKAQVDAHIAASEALIRQGEVDRDRFDRQMTELADAQAEQSKAISYLAEALPIVARSTPNED